MDQQKSMETAAADSAGTGKSLAEQAKDYISGWFAGLPSTPKNLETAPPTPTSTTTVTSIGGGRRKKKRTKRSKKSAKKTKRAKK
jgi:hypothetical protein